MVESNPAELTDTELESYLEALYEELRPLNERVAHLSNLAELARLERLRRMRRNAR